MLRTLTALLLLAACGRQEVAFDQKFTAYDQILHRYVSDGRVDYAGLAKGGRGELDQALAQMAQVQTSQLQTWTRDRRLAFWINVYNATMLSLVVDRYPIKSVRDIGPFERAVFLYPVVRVPASGSWRMSLHTLETAVLREGFQEPRVHFAINCASRSCPELRAAAWTAETLDADLDAAAATFLADRTKNRLDLSKDTLYLSQIFVWYADDFVAGFGSVDAFLDNRWPAMERVARRSATQVKYLSYDWSLNTR